jgi:glycosyltransferase
MRLTVITATYNSFQHIHDVLESIRQQSYSNIEYIVIDGGSTDKTIECIKQSNLVSQIVSEPDKGIYDALNKGIRLATGDIIGFLHSDDMFASSQTLQNIVTAFNSPSIEPSNSSKGIEQKRIDVVYGDLVFVDKQDTSKVVRYWKSQPFNHRLLQRGWMPAHPTIFMRRKVYEKHGIFDISLKCAADYDFILRVFKDQTLVKYYLPEVITKMRVGGMSTSGIKNIINKKKEDYLVLKNNKMSFPLWILLAKNISKIPQLIFKKH